MAHIMVIDDDAQVRRMLADMLSREGHQVTTAADGREGVQRFKEQPVELVITDILMPDKEGLETIADLRQLAPGLPIIAISGGGQAMPQSLTLLLAERLGAGATLAKPFTRAQLLEKVAMALPGR